MMEFKASFLLKIAEGLVKEVVENTEGVISESQLLKSRGSREGFWDSFKTLGAAAGLIHELENNLNLALKLCDKTIELEPEVELENGETPDNIKAKAYFQLGFIASGEKRARDAVRYFEESLSLIPDQVTYFNLGLCFLQMKGMFSGGRKEDAIASLQKCIEINPDSEIAVSAGKELARLGKL